MLVESPPTSKNCVCVEQNLACTSICGCRGNEECRNQLSHQLPVAENLGNLCIKIEKENTEITTGA
jgi:hypothetical protein